MSEKAFWNYLRKGMTGKWQSVRIESSASGGVPDVAYSKDGVHGWIELKFIPSWPVRESTPLRVPHLTPQQRLFILKHGSAGEHCFLFLKVGSTKDYFLFDHTNIASLGEVKRANVSSIALSHWTDSVDFDQLGKVLSR